MRCTPDEILALAIQKMHPSLDSAFREAGMPVEQSSAANGNNLTVTGQLLKRCCDFFAATMKVSLISLSHADCYGH